MKKAFRIILGAVLLIMVSAPAVFADEAAHTAADEALPIWSIIPFVGMLLSIAIIPQIKPEWWDRNMLWASLAWSALFIIPFAIKFGVGEAWYRLLESVLIDFVPFIVLLFGLFVVAGGIAIKGTIAGTTKVNMILLLIGTVLASWIGTTGAAMVLIRPVLRANAWRKKKAHVVIFFIFLVANMGGCLTPLGDPPLFMGFQRGVPFLWTTTHLLPILVFNVVIMMVVFFLIDRHYYKQEIAEGRSPEDMMSSDMPKEKISIEGGHNIIFIAMIIFGVIMSGVIGKALPEGAGIHVFDDCTFAWGSLVECIIILVAAFLSLKTTRKSTRDINEFTYAPIAEVFKLFIGIFITMIPALAILRVHGAGLGLDQPFQLFWATGALSSFLDNTPTYLVFLQVAGALGETSGVLTSVGWVHTLMLEAISAGAVFMGAITYIGNAPNFMVKSIAEENKIKMPSFFGYMGWSCAILVPLFIIDTLVFFI